ncbi:phosphoribosylanthranilate isomerase [Sphingomonas cavernae]|uniref:N-(5'-phosphoribosyl)anthranilate isomerase n=1 Tax=Sphingomonas cavernae TaxID=2320861 RepID=A0A418WP89_9SPHN|nr:phosphoribosylanthranilate isomerase [Sphingomonas cavernae]RJF93040.1 phosphoribosylanthranilate isomerase [Sphingomonas cavernae]
MPRITAKICGLSTPETLDAAVAGGASHIGLVFFPKSPRHVQFGQAAALAQRVPAHVLKAGVFVDPDDALLDAAIAAGGLDVIQLHGKEAPERAAAVKARSGKEVWKALHVRTSLDLAGAGSYRGAADRLLYDAKTPEGADLPGGMGLRFDWRLLQGFSHPLAWALSGGLDAANVGEAVGITGAALVDVSSGVESAPGIKDVDKIAAFLKATAQL